MSCFNEYNIICPYCGHVLPNSLELSEGDLSEGKIKCEKCGDVYQWKRRQGPQPKYNTYEIKKDKSYKRHAVTLFFSPKEYEVITEGHKSDVITFIKEAIEEKVKNGCIKNSCPECSNCTCSTCLDKNSCTLFLGCTLCKDEYPLYYPCKRKREQNNE